MLRKTNNADKTASAKKAHRRLRKQFRTGFVVLIVINSFEGKNADVSTSQSVFTLER
jgi:hypothetical protein